MQAQMNQTDFSNQIVYAGIDVNKTKWVVSLRMGHMELKRTISNKFDQPFEKALSWSRVLQRL